MNGENHFGIRNKLLILTFLALFLPTTTLIDCRTACHKCHDNSDDKQILEVYCAMCEECKQRRREKLQARIMTTEAIRPPTIESRLLPMHGLSEEEHQNIDFSVSWTKKSLPTMNPNYDYLHNTYTPETLRSNIVYPPGCPTPPPCPESEEVTMKLSAPENSPPAPWTPQCPPIITCRKRKRFEYQPCFSSCNPMCMYPMTPPCISPTLSTTTEKQFYRVFIGVPKNLLRKS